MISDVCVCVFCFFSFVVDYFPELARQKRLLDRKHQGRRRNYWNKVPRKESDEKDDRVEVEVVPRWEEKETIEKDDNSDVTQDECQPQEE